MIKGGDSSRVQGLLPFPQLAALGMRFVILKAQQGNDGFDPCFERNMKAALAAGIVPFAYCFAYPLPGDKPGRDPKQQAKLCVDRLYRFPEMRGRPIFVDLEWPEPSDWTKWGCTAAQIAAWCRDFCAEIFRLTGVRPIIYTYPWWWAAVSNGGDVAWAAEYALWLAAYIKGWPAEGTSPRIPAPWKTWLFWQFDGNGGLVLPNGLDADFCVFNGTEDDLQALTRGAPPAPPVVDGPIVHADDEMLEVELQRYRERQARILEMAA